MVDRVPRIKLVLGENKLSNIRFWETEDGFETAFYQFSGPRNQCEYGYDESTMIEQMMGDEPPGDFWIVVGEKETHLEYNTSDLFAWGYAASYPVGEQDIFGMYEHWLEKRDWLSAVRYFCKKGNQKPQAPIERSMKSLGLWDDEMEALPACYYDFASQNRKRIQEQLFPGIDPKKLNRDQHKTVSDVISAEYDAKYPIKSSDITHEELQ